MKIEFYFQVEPGDIVSVGVSINSVATGKTFTVPYEAWKDIANAWIWIAKCSGGMMSVGFVECVVRTEFN